MKKRKFAIFSLLIVLLLSFSGFQYYKYQRVHNIFDEIYYEESDYHNCTFLWKGRAFYKLKGLKIIDNGSQDLYKHAINYESVNLPKAIHSLGYYFYFNFQGMTEVELEMRLRIPDTETTINIEYLYDVNNRQLERFMWYYDDESTGYFQQSQVEDFLAKHGKTVDEIRKEADNVLRNKVLKDWTTIYSSRFSPDNWGAATDQEIRRTE